MSHEMSKVSASLSSAHEPTPSVDSHFHVFKAGHSLPGARYTPPYDASFDNWQTRSAAVGVTHGVLVQTSFMGTDNRLLLAQLALHPETLRGIAVVTPDADLKALSAMHAQGVRGIRLNLAGRSHDMAVWASASDLWDALLQLGWHVELHTDTGCLADVIDVLPLAMPLVLDHFAKPVAASSHDATVVALRERRSRGGQNVHIKLSAPYRLVTSRQDEQAGELARLWLAELGPEALLWGSDWPCTNHESKADYPALHSALGEWLAGDDRLVALVRSTNPLQLYWP